MWIDSRVKMPQSGVAVLGVVDGKVLRVQYVAKYEIDDVGNYNGDPDYCEANDTYYWPAGWYEWNEYEETHWAVDGYVTHWQLLACLGESGRLTSITLLSAVS